MTIDRLTNIYKMKEKEETVKKETIDLPGKIVKVDDVRNNIEDLDDYLARKLGASGLPLAYVARDAVAAPAIDPGFGLPSAYEEMIARGDHTQPAYQVDNVEVWNVIRHMTHGGMAWSWVSAHSRTQNGREAYLALKTHYLGESYQNRIKAAADSTLNRTYFDGQRSFTFEQYISTLQKAFTDLESTGEAVAEERKVRLLLRGITAPSMTTGVGIVMSTPALKTNYEAAVNYLAETHDSLKQAASAKRNISSVQKTSTKKGKTKQKVAKKTKSSYYSYKDWWKLTEEQREEVRNKRKEQQNNRNRQSLVQTVVTGTVTDVSTNENVTGDTTPTTSNQNVGSIMSRRAHRGN
jgi:hypothetical protein